MLTNVHVKNLALIDSADIFFSGGLNVLSGETGAGKTILMSAIHLALGDKFHKDMIRSGCSDALAELTFIIENDAQKEALERIGISFEDEVILTRKINDGRSISRINGEAVSSDKLKQAASVLMDLHTQSEHQSLLFKNKQMELLDLFGGEEVQILKDEVGGSYHLYTSLLKELEDFQTDESARQRELSLLEYEINEIDEAALSIGEDEELEALYKKLTNSREITGGLQTAHELTGYEDGAGSLIGRAYSSVNGIAQYDEKLEALSEQLSEIDNLLNDFNREISDYIADFEFEDDTFIKTENRLNLLNHIKMKYGKTIEEVLDYKRKQEHRLGELQDYEAALNQKKLKIEKQKKTYDSLCVQLTELRRKNALIFKRKIFDELLDLNFLQVRFEIALYESAPSANGKDRVEFMLSFNPGEDLRALERIASGGELSRFMLAVKTVLADNSLGKALLFDEIDAGISGITAQKVSQKLAKISGSHQVICITHLPQIASMADRHFKIEKSAMGNETLSNIEQLDRKGEIAELARMLSGAEITEAVLKNAEELKKNANTIKQRLKK